MAELAAPLGPCAVTVRTPSPSHQLASRPIREYPTVAPSDIVFHFHNITPQERRDEPIHLPRKSLRGSVITYLF